MPANIEVVYCSGWGFTARFNEFENMVKTKFQSKANSINIVGKKTPTPSGKFEVIVNGTLVHSKDKGHGFVDSTEKQEKIFNEISKHI